MNFYFCIYKFLIQKKIFLRFEILGNISNVLTFL